MVRTNASQGSRAMGRPCRIDTRGPRVGIVVENGRPVARLLEGGDVSPPKLTIRADNDSAAKIASAVRKIAARAFARTGVHVEVVA